jgi:hypothetical protein
MDIGMLWFDNDNNADLSAKIKRARTYYRKKYGKNPDLCFVHPCMLPGKVIQNRDSSSSSNGNGKAYKTEGVELRPTNSMLPNHFWLGINQKKTLTRA